jgi:hypothetical protein
LKEREHDTDPRFLICALRGAEATLLFLRAVLGSGVLAQSDDLRSDLEHTFAADGQPFEN